MEYFRQLGGADAAVSALGLTPGVVLAHLIAALTHRDLARVGFERLHLADAAVAAGCAAGDPAAWGLVSEHALLIQRAVSGWEPALHPALAAKRFLDGVRAATERDEDAALNIRRYAAETPLRVWLVDRVLGRQVARLRAPAARAVNEDLRLAIESLEARREHARKVVGLPPGAAVERLLPDSPR